jgi:hypothetical protein
MAAKVFDGPRLGERDVQLRTQEVRILMPQVEAVSPRMMFHVDINPNWLTIVQEAPEVAQPSMPTEQAAFLMHMSALHTPVVMAVPDRHKGTTRFLVTRNEEWVREAQRRQIPTVSVSMVTPEQLAMTPQERETWMSDLVRATARLAVWEAGQLISTKREMLDYLLRGMSDNSLR